MTARPQSEPILIKRYGRSRLYDTVNTRYLTLADLKDWQAGGVPFMVSDSETGEDVTRVLMA
jgi:polyhydroxyalkanoate synthesis regulator protein